MGCHIKACHLGGMVAPAIEGEDATAGGRAEGKGERGAERLPVVAVETGGGCDRGGTALEEEPEGKAELASGVGEVEELRRGVGGVEGEAECVASGEAAAEGEVMEGLLPEEDASLLPFAGGREGEAGLEGIDRGEGAPRERAPGAVSGLGARRSPRAVRSRCDWRGGQGKERGEG